MTRWNAVDDRRCERRGVGGGDVFGDVTNVRGQPTTTLLHATVTYLPRTTPRLPGDDPDEPAQLRVNVNSVGILPFPTACSRCTTLPTHYTHHPAFQFPAAPTILSWFIWF